MSEAETPGGAPKPTSQLAADRLGYHRSALVKALNDSRPSPNWDWEILNTWDALVARITDLEARVAACDRGRRIYRDQRDAAEAQVAALTAQLENEAAGVDVALQNARLLNIVRDLEAQVAALTAQVGAASDREAGLSDALDDVRERLAALTQERDEWRDRAGKGHATALDMLATTRQALTEVSERQPKTIDWLRANGIVFDGPLGIDPGNWEHVAFSIYNDLCEADDIARRALAATDTTDV